MSPILDVLNEMRRRKLGMYIGSTSLTRLKFFLLGYEHAVCRLQPHQPDRFLADFRKWIYQRYNTKENVGWEELILRESSDEYAAVERFWELLDEFIQQRQPVGAGSASPAVAVPEPAASTARPGTPRS